MPVVTVGAAPLGDVRARCRSRRRRRRPGASRSCRARTSAVRCDRSSRPRGRGSCRHRATSPRTVSPSARCTSTSSRTRLTTCALVTMTPRRVDDESGTGALRLRARPLADVDAHDRGPHLVEDAADVAGLDRLRRGSRRARDESCVSVRTGCGLRIVVERRDQAARDERADERTGDPADERGAHAAAARASLRRTVRRRHRLGHDRRRLGAPCPRRGRLRHDRLAARRRPTAAVSAASSRRRLDRLQVDRLRSRPSLPHADEAVGTSPAADSGGVTRGRWRRRRARDP